MGTGKYKGVLGSLRVRWNDSKLGEAIFNVGSGFSDEERKEYKEIFPLDTLIRLKFWEISDKSGKPRFPIYDGVRDKRDI
jgi:ATP-dependent DNA ligase